MYRKMLILPFLLLLAACQVVSVPVRHMEAAQRSIPSDVQQIAMFPYEYTPNLPPDFNYVRESLPAQIGTKITKIGSYKILERAELEKVMKEGVLQYGPSMSAADIDEVGTISGADAIVVGKINNINVEDRTVTKNIEIRQESKDPDLPAPPPQVVPVQQLVRKVTMNITSEMLHVADKSKIATDTFSFLYDSEKDGSVNNDGGLFLDDQQRLAHYQNQPARMPTNSAIIENGIAECAQKFYEQISAHEISDSVKLMKGSADGFEQGMEWAKQGQFKNAIGEFQKATTSPEQDDKLAALFNIGACNEGLGNFVEALSFYHQCSQLSEAKQRISVIRRYNPGL